MKKCRIEFKIFVDGESEPELTGYRKVPWPDEETFDELAERELIKACRELHTPKVKEWYA